MIGMVDPARKDVFVKRAAPVFEPRQNASAGGLKELELNGPTGLLLDDDCARPNPTAADEVADHDLHEITPAELAVDSQIEHCPVAHPAFAVEPEADGPDLLRFERALGAKQPACVPRTSLFGCRITL
jgi:hypothetical protein